MSKHRKTFQNIFADPIRANILWSDIETLLLSLGAEREEGRGSRIRFSLNGVRAVFHRHHPKKEMDRGAVSSVRRFLEEGGIKP